jgi:hypothetical protein
MPMRRLLPALAAVALVAGACADAGPSAPEGSGGEDARTGTQVGTDSLTHPPLPAAVRVRGRALVATTDGPRAPGDTLSAFVPIEGARVTLYRNVLVDGKGVSVKLAEHTTGADGAYEFAGVPGGYYILALNVTPERFYGETFVYVAGTRSEVSADIRVWRAAP